jgi:hypothetical protein
MPTEVRILSYRQQVIADHSSTNYLFYSPKPLSKEARAVVSQLSSHVDVGARTADITYHGDYADLGEDRRRKFLEHYDVEVRESYDWWDLSIMLEPEKLPDVDRVKQYEETDGEATLTFKEVGQRLCLQLGGCQLDYESCYAEFGQGLMKGLAKLAAAVREELYAGKNDALAVMAAYCGGDEGPDEELSPAAQTLGGILEPI